MDRMSRGSTKAKTWVSKAGWRNTAARAAGSGMVVVMLLASRSSDDGEVVGGGAEGGRGARWILLFGVGGGQGKLGTCGGCLGSVYECVRRFTGGQ